MKLKEVSIDNEIRKSVIDQFLNKESSVKENKENFLGDLQTNKEISTNNDIQWLIDDQISCWLMVGWWPNIVVDSNNRTLMVD